MEEADSSSDDNSGDDQVLGEVVQVLADSL